MMSKTILEVINLKKYFVNKGSVNKAVDDVSFDVKEGEIVGLIGESGSGKTTIGRSLLRLYDDYNGFVRLDGQIISGKKISRKRRKFMRKNIQMIFQDPMASLNGQNTIYSILKEPLIVNGIIKNKRKDIASDWYKVKQNFRYTFLEQALKFQLQNLEISIDLHTPFIKKWQKQAYQVSFDLENNLDDQFNSYFGYLEDRTKINSVVINGLYTNTEKLIALYEQKQQDFRNQRIDFDEVELENARNNYNHQFNLLFLNQNFLDLKATYTASNNKYLEIKNNYNDVANISKNSVRNFQAEIKNEYKMHRNDAYSSYSLDFFFHKYKLYLINKQLYKELSANLNKLLFLDFEDLKQLATEFKQYSQDFYANNLIVDTTKKASIKQIKQIIKEQYNFDLTKYIEKSANLKQQLLQEKRQACKTKFADLLQVVKAFFKGPKVNLDNFKNAKNQLKQAQATFDAEAEKYVLEYNKRIEVIKQQIEQKQVILADLKAQDDAIFAQFKLNHKNFTEFYTNQIIKPLEKAKKDTKEYAEYKQHIIDLKVYQTNVADRLNGIKSFVIESKYLNKNLHNIYSLLGITKLDLKTTNSWLDKPLNFVMKPIRMAKIGELYAQNIIYKALEDVGLLKQFAYRYPHEFSGGQRQRIVIARALITEPKVIVADEPIASLDISIQAQVVNLLKDLCKQKNIGMVFIAHDLSMIEYVADRVQIMHLGKIVESGKTENIYQNAVHPYTLNLFKAIPKISNANEKFQDVKFELSYLEEQTFPNVASQFVISEGMHYVYGTQSQFENWTSGKIDKDE
ncbi:ATP-binding cassette domain-containing protein [Mycoplasma nasistruthionis]|uniref:ATP-binding cassette domain-containing protein n=2 Tax=Mycoplasma nasistruthionis TaxID=353852 RepID=A0A5B7XUQ8_9MOLU|nr:ATP-binding cassette domain-containing protein [Mycoplasma nasistruthionis]